MFKRIQWLWKPDARDGTAEEPGEALFRKWALIIAMLVGPPVLLLIYHKTMFPGLVNSDALDYAQIGRNLHAGRGFVTYVLRPLALGPQALAHNSNPAAQPDVTHGPLYPFLLALAFVAGPKDTVVAAVSGLFYLLTIPVVYLLGVRVFNRAVGLLAAAILMLNALMLEYATSGLPITLYVFLTTCLLLLVYNIAAASRSANGKLPRSQYMLAGITMGLLYLTDPVFFWVAPFLIGAVYMLTPSRKGAALAALLVPMAVLMLPWMARNMALTGNPIFGLRGMEVWMNTKGHYPGYTAYRQFPADIVPGMEVFRSVVQKVLLGTGEIIQAFPQVTASWVLAFFLPCLLFRFSDAPTNALRRMMLLALLGLFMGSLLFKVQMPLFVAVIPTMLVFSVAYLLHLVQEAKLRPGSVALVATLVGVAISFPLLSDMTLTDKVSHLKAPESAKKIKNAIPQNDIVLSDQPWVVAWYADRPSMLVPLVDGRIADLRGRFPNKLRWMLLTEASRGLSPTWERVYTAFAQWNLQELQAEANHTSLNPIRVEGNGQTPIADGLNGFTSIPTPNDTSPTVVLAYVPTTQEIGARTDASDEHRR